MKPRVLEKFDKNYWSAIKRGDKEEAARIKADWEEVEDQACKVAHSFIPVVGSATEACEAFDEGKYVEGAIYTALAVAEAVPIITLASKGLKAGNLVAKVAQVAAAGEKAAMKQMVVEGGEVVGKPIIGEALEVGVKGLASNPFKGKTFSQIDEIFKAKGFTIKGVDPLTGKGSYFSPWGTRYYFDKGGMYKKGFEGPHVDIWYNGHPLFEKVKFFLDGSPKIYKPLK